MRAFTAHPLPGLLARLWTGRPAWLRPVLLLAVLSLSLNLYGINWGLPNRDDWSNLSLAPLKPLSFAKHLLYLEPWFYHYPPLHFIVLALVYAPYILYLRVTGGLGVPSDTYPFGLADPDGSLTVFTLLARLTSVAMGTGLVLVNYLTVRRFYDARSAFVSSVLIAFSYPIVHFSHNANVDVPYLFWTALALYCFVRLLGSSETRWYLLLALFTAFAVGTKHTVYALMAGLLPSLLYAHYRHAIAAQPDRSRLAAFFDRRFAYASGLFGLTLVAIFNPLLNWDGFTAHFGRHLGRSFAGGGSWVLQAASSSLHGHLELIGRYLDYVRQSNGTPAFVLIAAGFVYCLVRYPGRSLIVALPIVSYYVLYLQNFGTHHLRYILPVYLLFTWQAGKLASDASTLRSIPRWAPQLVLAVVLGSSLVHGFTVDFFYARDPRYVAEQWIQDNIPRGTKVLAMAPTYSLPRLPRDLDLAFRNPWDFNGNLVTDITDIPAEYVVVGMSIPRRSQSEKWKVKWVKEIDVEAFLTERGYREVASFKTPPPAWGADVPDIHVINPRVVIWKSVEGDRPSASPALRPAASR
jgi:4-amino-4-deoxy-L-arabinose transferase-like glycosyltransferase